MKEVEKKVREMGGEVKPVLEGETREKWGKEGGGEVLRRTRGNLVVGGTGVGAEAWAEDGWGVVRVGEEGGEGGEMVVVSMCGRCQVRRGALFFQVQFEAQAETRQKGEKDG